MALIKENDLKSVIKTRNSIHNEVASTYTSFTKNGEKYFQIDTYGSKEREFKDKISQSLQIDREVALKLVEILKREFAIK